MKHFRTIILLLLCGLASLAPAATTHYVVTNNTPGVVPNTPYNTWTNAATNFFTVLGACVANDTIIVSNGVYLVTNEFLISIPGITLQSVRTNPADVVLAGEFPVVWHRVLGLNSPNISVIGITLSNGYQTSGAGVNIYGGADGVTLTNCVITCNRATGNYGGGAAVGALRTRFNNCTISGNIMTNASGGAGLQVTGELIASNCVFANNQNLLPCGYYGGGLSLQGTSTSYFYNCVISNNYLANGLPGGGGYNSAPMRMIGCTLIGNTGGGGGGWNIMCAATVISNCVITRNVGTSATSYGGGGLYASTPGMVVNSIISSNYTGFGGGGIRFDGNSTGFAFNCQIVSNRANGSGGGVAFMGKGGELRNCLVYSNASTIGSGGGVLTYSANATSIVNSCTIVGNVAVHGGGLYLDYSNNIVLNSIIYSNTATTAGENGDLYTLNPSANCTSYFYCCTSSNLNLTNPQGNITNYPQFRDPAANNFRLMTNSLCINSGTNLLSWMAGGVDVEGYPRITAYRVDRGAYENSHPYPYIYISNAFFTNTLMVGGSTNSRVAFTNRSELFTINYTNYPSSGWISCSPCTGSVSALSQSSFIITNSALGRSPGGYMGTVNVLGSGAFEVRETATVWCVMNVLGLDRSPDTLANMVQAGRSTSDTFRVWSLGPGTVGYQITSDVPWIVVSPSTGQSAGETNTITATYTNTVSLGFGTHYGTITISVTNYVAPSLLINVTLTVNPSPILNYSPGSFAHTLMQGQNVAGETLRVWNESLYYAFGYTATWSVPWVSVNSNSGYLGASATNTLGLSYQASTLPSGYNNPSNYAGVITITGTDPTVIGSPARVFVSLQVNPRPALAISQAIFTNTTMEGRDAASQSFRVWNAAGYYTLSYTVSDDVPWLIPSVVTGTSTGEHDEVVLQYSTASLACGVSNATVTIVGRAFDGASFDSAVDATQQVYVSLRILPRAILGCDASSVYSQALRQGEAAQERTFRVWNASVSPQGTMSFQVSSSAGWLSVSPVSGVSTGEQQTVTVRCEVSSLAPGETHQGTITITGVDLGSGDEAVGSPSNTVFEILIRVLKGLDFAGSGLGACDLVVYRENLGIWGISNLVTGFATNVVLGGTGFRAVPGDYDGDGVTDFGLWRSTTGYWYTRTLHGGLIGVYGEASWGLGGYQPVSGDYDGDGRMDPAVYNEALGIWVVQFSSQGYAPGQIPLGGALWSPVVADFDGDVKVDPGIYRETTGDWILLFSSLGYVPVTGQFGGPGYRPVLADFDGDGKADPAVYGEATGIWAILPSSSYNGRVYSVITGVLGGPGFLALAADYDGDGFADAAVYQKATGNWYVVSLDGNVLAWPAFLGGYGFIPVEP